MMSFKLFALLAIASASELTHAAEADWEVLNMALDNINAANPTVLKNSILNIVSGFLPNDLSATTTAAPVQPQPVVIVNPAPTAAPTPAPTVAPTQPAPAPVNLQQLLFLYPQLLQAMTQSAQPAPAPIAPQQQQSNAVITQIFDHGSHEKCDCKKKPKSLAEFLVNVPCPTTTTTEKPLKRIVVKVPCPTTTTTTEKPCACQCCPCNPCAAKKTKSRKPVSSEESEETVYRTYVKSDMRRQRPYFSDEE